jgi:hypothetical protein
MQWPRVDRDERRAGVVRVEDGEGAFVVWELVGMRREIFRRLKRERWRLVSMVWTVSAHCGDYRL